MKYCPYCGEELTDPQTSFCPECGKPLADAIPSPEPERSAPKKKPGRMAKRKKERERKSEQSTTAKPAEVSPEDEGYDGYYDDVLPSDNGGSKEGIDIALVKKIALLLGIMLLVIGACVAMMYLI